MSEMRIPSLAERVRELLEDFEPLATMGFMILLRRETPLNPAVPDIYAGIVRSEARLSSIDYAQRSRPFPPELMAGLPRNPELAAYIDAYFVAKSYMNGMTARLVTEGRPEAPSGVYRSSVVLQRLPTSFFSAHLLYQLGQRYEGHATSRLILEQIAWAYAVCSMDRVSDIEAVQSTRAITALREVVPHVGRLYGILSEEAHISTWLHPSMLVERDDETRVAQTAFRFRDYAAVILGLADLFGIVWEVSQADYLDEFSATTSGPNGVTVREDRIFLTKIEQCLDRFDSAEAQAS